MRVPKDSTRIHAYGTLDELNAAIGLALAGTVPETLRSRLERVQQLLFRAGADLATYRQHNAAAATVPRIEEVHVHEMDQWIADLEPTLPPLTHFILPGGTQEAAHLHLCRTICRRAERLTVALAQEEDIGAAIVPFLNRLSDYLFLAAREANIGGGGKEMPVQYD